MRFELLRSGTAIGALVRESRNAESKMDFIHKLGISQKECDETLYRPELLKETNFLSGQEFESLHQEARELLKMIKSAILNIKKSIKSAN